MRAAGSRKRTAEAADLVLKQDPQELPLPVLSSEFASQVVAELHLTDMLNMKQEQAVQPITTTAAEQVQPDDAGLVENDEAVTVSCNRIYLWRTTGIL